MARRRTQAGVPRRARSRHDELGVVDTRGADRPSFRPLSEPVLLDDISFSDELLSDDPSLSDA
jgi:hypothetical protein